MTGVKVEHPHQDRGQVMELVRVERVDGLALEHYACTCGHAVILLSRVDGERQGPSWPVQWLQASPPEH